MVVVVGVDFVEVGGGDGVGEGPAPLGVQAGKRLVVKVESVLDKGMVNKKGRQVKIKGHFKGRARSRL